MGIESVKVYDLRGQERDWAWLRDKYGRIELLDAGDPPKFALVRIDETKGPAVIKVRVIDQNGAPIARQPVINHWPDPKLPDLTAGGFRTLWHDRGLPQHTNPEGFTDFALGPGSFIRDKEAGGPHTIWIGSPSYPSDGVEGVGMLGGTNHMGPMSLTYVLITDPIVKPSPPPGSQTEILEELRAIRAVLEQLSGHLGAEVREQR